MLPSSYTLSGGVLNVKYAAVLSSSENIARVTVDWYTEPIQFTSAKLA